MPVYVPGPDGIIDARKFRPAEIVGGVPSPRETALVYHDDHLGSVTAITNHTRSVGRGKALRFGVGNGVKELVSDCSLIGDFAELAS